MRFHRLPTLLVVLVVLVLLAAVVPPAGATLPPLAPQPEDAATQPRYSDDLARFEEAETKARALAKAQIARQVKVLVTPGMELYDVLAYDLEMQVDTVTETLTGTGTMTARVVGTSLDAIDMHLRPNMAVTGATADDAATSFSRDGEILTVQLDRTYVTDEIVIVGVDYNGNPEDGSGYFGWDSYDGQPLVWTLSEPYGARH
jgi:hypothetical protein